MQNLLSILLFSLSLCVSAPAHSQEVLFWQQVLMKTNLVSSCYEYKIHKKDSILISITDYTKSGQIEMQQYFEHKKESLKRIFRYDSTNTVKKEIIIRNKTDTTICNYSSDNPYIEVLTGGILCYIPTQTYYENGLLKSTTGINSKGEVTFYYKYTYFINKHKDIK